VLADEATPLAQLSRAAADKTLAAAEAEMAAVAGTDPVEKREAALLRLLSAQAAVAAAEAA
jgi:F-type H+-transporting ATPase subunit epsilon